MELTGTYTIKKKKGISDVGGFSKKPRLVFSGSDEDGKEVEIDQGEYGGLKFPSAIEDLTPFYETRLKSWGFRGDTKDLTRLIDKLNLYYERKHPKAGDLITSANVKDPNDPFFNHSKWWDNPLVMRGSSILLNAEDPENEFLLRCYMGRSKTQVHDEESNPLVEAGMLFIVMKTSDEDADSLKRENLEIDLISKIAELPHEKAVTISVILGLMTSTDMPLPVDSIKPNLKKAILKTSINPGEKRIFEGKSYQSFFTELLKDKADILNKKMNIKVAINRNVLRYKDGDYLLKGKRLAGVTTFSELYKYFVENKEDYGELIDGLTA